MQKIRIVTDSASDISKVQSQKYGVHVIGFHIIVGDKEYREGVDFTTEEFYDILETSPDLPHTSQILREDYFEVYKESFKNEVTDIINVVISSTGSKSYDNAIMAKNEFYDAFPDAVGKMNIHIMDSKGYTGAYGFPVLKAGEMALKGERVETITSFLQEWFDSVIIVCAAYTLKYARKSGRVSSVAAFVGEALGVKPIITFTDAVSETVEKVRGNKAVIPKLFEVAHEKMIPNTPYAILVGSNKEQAEELTKMMVKATGRPPEYFLQVGATIACHIGHDVAGIIIKSENRAAGKPRG